MENNTINNILDTLSGLKDTSEIDGFVPQTQENLENSQNLNIKEMKMKV